MEEGRQMKTIQPSPALRGKMLARINHAGECWEWALARNRQGYGVYNLGNGNGMYLAHRVSYTAFVGPIPDGLVIDHLCRNTACINPAHLEPVSVRTNSLRGMSPTAKAIRTGRCKRDHLIKSGTPCRPCNAIREANRRGRIKERLRSETMVA